MGVILWPNMYVLQVHGDSRGCGHLQHPGLSVSPRIVLDEGTIPGIIIDSLNNVFFRCLRVHMPCLSYAPSSYGALNILATLSFFLNARGIPPCPQYVWLSI